MKSPVQVEQRYVLTRCSECDLMLQMHLLNDVFLGVSCWEGGKLSTVVYGQLGLPFSWYVMAAKHEEPGDFDPGDLSQFMMPHYSTSLIEDGVISGERSSFIKGMKVRYNMQMIQGRSHLPKLGEHAKMYIGSGEALYVFSQKRKKHPSFPNAYFRVL